MTDAEQGERGASSVEYGLLIALIAAVIFGAVVAFGGEVGGLFTSSNDSIGSAITP